MILTIDIGNSRIKWAQWQLGVIVKRDAIFYGAEDYSSVVDDFFSTVEKPSRIFVVCVAANELTKHLDEWVKQHWQLPAEYLRTAKQYKNVIHAYSDPAQHGADRWAGVVAANQSCPENSLCVIGAGTATTFDFVDKNARHLGGYILPSYATMRASLLADTANVSAEFKPYLDAAVIPDNTSDAVNQGCHKLLQAGIREICQLAKNEMSGQVQIIITGGYAETILAYPDMPVMLHKPDLVMQGLYSIMLDIDVGMGS